MDIFLFKEKNLFAFIDFSKLAKKLTEERFCTKEEWEKWGYLPKNDEKLFRRFFSDF